MHRAKPELFKAYIDDERVRDPRNLFPEFARIMQAHSGSSHFGLHIDDRTKEEDIRVPICVHAIQILKDVTDTSDLGNAIDCALAGIFAGMLFGVWLGQTGRAKMSLEEDD